MTTRTDQDEASARVLYIEDDPLYGEIVAKLLAPLGCTVDLAENGANGLATFKEFSYDIVAVDYRLPDMTGIEVCLRLREANPDIPLVMITGQGKASTAVEALSIDIPHYLEKGNKAVFSDGLINTFRLLIKNLPSERK